MAAKPIADTLLAHLVTEAGAFVDSGAAAFIGVETFTAGSEPGAVLSQADAALALAEAEGVSAARMARPAAEDDSPQCAVEWTRIIRAALESRRVRLISFPVTDFAGRLIHRECPLRLKFDDGGEWQPAGRFLPMAERLKLTPQIDLAAVALGLDELSAAPALPGLAINLSPASVHDAAFRDQLIAILRKRGEETRRLWLDIGESGALRNIDSIRALCRELKGTGCRIGLEHFGRYFSQIGQWHDIGLDYVKVDTGFVHDLHAHQIGRASCRERVS
jgi:EAL domain-containing protein (putative c-di-GMP-specific phosphodiesterase class I)